MIAVFEVDEWRRQRCNAAPRAALAVFELGGASINVQILKR